MRNGWTWGFHVRKFHLLHSSPSIPSLFTRRTSDIMQLTLAFPRTVYETVLLLIGEFLQRHPFPFLEQERRERPREHKERKNFQPIAIQVSNAFHDTSRPKRTDGARTRSFLQCSPASRSRPEKSQRQPCRSQQRSQRQWSDSEWGMTPLER